MRQALLSAFAFALLAAPAAAQNVDVREVVLENGMQVLIVRHAEAPRVYCALFFKVGAVNEVTNKTGLAHLHEHMLFKGTRVLGVKDAAANQAINDAIDKVHDGIHRLRLLRLECTRRGAELDPADDAALADLEAQERKFSEDEKPTIIKDDLWNRYLSNGGTGLNASTGQDSTQYFVEVPANKIELFFWMESDRIRHNVFREFYSELEVVKEERRLRTDSTPTGRVYEAFNAMFWEAHPYGNPVIGWPSDLDFLTRRDAEEFFRTYYAPNNCIAVLVGDLDPDKTEALARAYFAPIPRGAQPPPPVLTLEPFQPGEKRMHAQAEAPNQVSMVHHAAAARHPDSFALSLLAEILAGQSGRLTTTLVNRDKLALSAGASYSDSKYGGAFRLSAQPKDGVEHRQVEDALSREAAAVAESGVTENELRKAKNQMLAGTITSLRSNSGIAWALSSAALNGDWRDALKALDRYEAVTAAQVKDVAGKYIAKENRSVLWIERKPKKEAGATEK